MYVVAKPTFTTLYRGQLLSKFVDVVVDCKMQKSDFSLMILQPRMQPNVLELTMHSFQVLGSVGALPDIYLELEVSYYLLRRLLGVRVEGDKKGAKVSKLSKNEVLMVNIGSLSAGGRVIAVKADLAKIGLTTPVCTSIGEKIALSRRVEKHWRLIGWGQIRNGSKVKPTTE